jgi:hypothetical protein
MVGCPPRPEDLTQLQPGSNTALSIIVVGLWDTKVGDHCVVQILRHIAFQDADDLCTSSVVVLDNTLHLFQVTVARLRVEDLAVEHGEDAAFGRSSPLLRSARGQGQL